jgi:energy-coupling factor transport system ATP-binding protein
VHDLDLTIEPGERVLLLGASGAGKSTILAGLAGVLGGDDDGEHTGELLIDRLPADAARGRAGLLLQDPETQVILARVGDDVAFGCENLGVPPDEIWRRVDESLDAVGLRLPRDHPTTALSGGQKQRLALAGILAMRPGLLLLDEPTANLDPDGVTEVRDAVARVIDTTGSTLVIVEHRVAVWQSLVDRVIVVEVGGGIRADGPPQRVLARDGASLAASGVWVPGFSPVLPTRKRTAEAPVAIQTRQLAIARVPGTVVASHLECAVQAGRLLALTGANGSGKSTLALTIGGLLKPAAGSVDAKAIAGQLGPSPIDWASRELLPRIGSVFQQPEHQFLAGNVSAELAIGPRALRMPRPDIEATVHSLAARLHLEGLLDANPFTLSGGEKRRLSVATALATRPAVLVLDEPTFGQDSRTWAELVALIAELLDDGVAVVAASHDQQFVDALADAEFAMPVRTAHPTGVTA